jgi:hypothetical protein
MEKTSDLIYIRNVDTETNEIIDTLMTGFNVRVRTKAIVFGLKSIPCLKEEISDLRQTITNLQAKIELLEQKNYSVLSDIDTYLGLAKATEVAKSKLIRHIK